MIFSEIAISILENAFKNCICSMAAILYQPQCVKRYTVSNQTTIVACKESRQYFSPLVFCVDRVIYKAGAE